MAYALKKKKSDSKQKSVPKEKLDILKEELKKIDISRLEDALRSILHQRFQSQDTIVKKLSTDVKPNAPVDPTSPESQKTIEVISDKLEKELFDLILSQLIVKYNKEDVVKRMHVNGGCKIIKIRGKIRKLIKKTLIGIVPIFSVISKDNVFNDGDNNKIKDSVSVNFPGTFEMSSEKDFQKKVIDFNAYLKEISNYANEILEKLKSKGSVEEKESKFSKVTFDEKISA